MAIYSGKSKSSKGKKSSPMKSDDSPVRKPRYEVEQIKNGFILTKSWEEKNKEGYTDYKTEKTYHDKNPIDL
jgi:hypothetical protein